MKVLVTGATGFIGSKLVPRLVAAGHQIRTIGRAAALPPELSDLSVEHFSGDITDPQAVARAVAGCEVVYHLAGLVSYRKSDRAYQYQVNVVGTGNVMKAALQAGVG